MKVLVLNCGSSSIKYKLFEMTTKEVLAQGGIEKIGLPGSFLKLTLPSGEKKIIEKDVPEHTTGVQFIFDTLTNPEYGAVKDLHEIKAVGHRVLHGGTKFSGSVLIDNAVIAAVEECWPKSQHSSTAAITALSISTEPLNLVPPCNTR